MLEAEELARMGSLTEAPLVGSKLQTFLTSKRTGVKSLKKIINLTCRQGRKITYIQVITNFHIYK